MPRRGTRWLLQPCAGESGVFVNNGSLTDGRFGHTATLLPDGKVLVAGGYTGGSFVSLASAELYDPASGTWTTTGSLGTARGNHTATLLSNDKVDSTVSAPAPRHGRRDFTKVINKRPSLGTTAG